MAGSLDVNGWLLGIWSAAISGGAGAISSGFGTILVDPSDFNLQTPAKLLKVMMATFGFSALVSLMKFLQMHPAPDVKTVTASVQIEKQPGQPPKTVTTVTESHTEPVVKP